MANSEAGSEPVQTLEIRTNEKGLDELLIREKDGKLRFHLERMGNDHWWMAAYDDDRSVYVNLESTRQIYAKVEVA